MSSIGIPQKTSNGKFILKEPLEAWIARSMAGILTILPITSENALEAYCLTDFHKDPADRIIATNAITP